MPHHFSEVEDMVFVDEHGFVFYFLQAQANAGVDIYGGIEGFFNFYLDRERERFQTAHANHFKFYLEPPGNKDAFPGAYELRRPDQKPQRFDSLVMRVKL